MLVGNWIGSADLSASLSSLSNFFFSLFAIVLLALTCSSSFLMAARGSANTFVCGSIAAITKEILAATASYSAKILEPVLLGDRVKLSFVLSVGVVRKYRALHLFRYRRHVPLSSDEPLDVLLCELNLRCRDLRR